ncbi:MAG: hypothetical protein DA328_08920 [Nitrososphaeraceae archaeon]|nr:hypothetical protein [Nitrososphaeraceae archaeon]
MTTNDAKIVGAPFSEPRYYNKEIASSATDTQIFRSPHPESNGTSRSIIRGLVLTNTHAANITQFIFWDEDTTADASVKAKKRGSNTAPLFKYRVPVGSSVYIEFPNLGFYVQQGLAGQASEINAHVSVWVDTVVA